MDALSSVMGRVSGGWVAYKKQDFAELKRHHREEATLFIDPTFPAIDSVIGTSSIPPNIQWKRPGDLCANPRLFSDIEKPQVVRPGEFSCNWIVSACAVLSGVHEIRNKVIPDYWEQEWDPARPEVYCGLFHFRLWRFGQWVDVVVDDLLPTLDNTLLTLQGQHENEFWPALVEKAYAKLHGSYDALREGHLSDALVDFTGGVSEVIDLQAEEYSSHEDKRREFFEILLNEMAHHSLMCFSVLAPLPSDIGTRTSLGINKGHAYHVTDVRRIHLAETNLRNLFKGRHKAAMVRLRDPRDEGRRPASADSDLELNNRHKAKRVEKKSAPLKQQASNEAADSVTSSTATQTERPRRNSKTNVSSRSPPTTVKGALSNRSPPTDRPRRNSKTNLSSRSPPTDRPRRNSKTNLSHRSPPTAAKSNLSHRSPPTAAKSTASSRAAAKVPPTPRSPPRSKSTSTSAIAAAQQMASKMAAATGKREPVTMQYVETSLPGQQNVASAVETVVSVAAPARRPKNGTRSTSEGEYAYSTSAITRMLSANGEWSKLKEHERTRLGLHLRDKSEFWMPLEDVVREFTELTVCRMLSRNVFAGAGAGRGWREQASVGAWQQGVLGTSQDRAGGASQDTMLRNPQYACDIKEDDELVIQLMQFHDTERIETEPVAFLNFLIGFFMLKVEENRSLRLHKQWPHCATVVSVGHKRRREVVYKGHLGQGRYLIVPTTYKAGECTNYYLRVFSRSNIRLRELKEDLPKCPVMLSCVTGDFEWATVVTIHSAECLTRVGESYFKSSRIYPYCTIKCETRRCSTPVARDDLYPTWNNSYVFYRKKTDKPLTIQVYSSNLLLPDSLLGECEIPAPITRTPTPLATTLIPRLRRRGKKDDDGEGVDLPSTTAGTLHLTILTEDNFMAV